MNKEELKSLCDLMMVSDPWLLPDADNNIIVTMLDREARKHGFENWVVAYHELP